jgi:PTS system arbutin-like IIC component
MQMNDSVMMQKVQRFGGAMFTPVLLFSFFGIMVALSILCKNPDIMGSIAKEGTLWYNLWFIIEKGAWTVFTQMPLLFVVALPIGLAQKNHARACMEALVIYIAFNYFISAMLMLWGTSFGVDYTQEAVSGSGLALIANIKTLDLGMLGAIFISAVSVYLHDKFFDVNLPDFLGVFKGSSLVVIVGFFVMIPTAYLFCLIWPHVQAGIFSLQGFLKASGVFGVWLYTLLERILIPTGLHHFVYTPFIFGPAAVDGGIKQYFFQHLNGFATAEHTLKEMFPQGGFALHGLSKMFGSVGIALAIYATAKPERKKAVAGLLVPATLTAVLCGITEPLEFTFLFIAPMLFAVHAILAASLAATSYMFGVVGDFGSGLIENAVLNWIPLFKYHSATYITQFVIGFIFTGIYFIVFRYLILKFDFKTPGRTDGEEEDRLYTKADFESQQTQRGETVAGWDERDHKAAAFLTALGGKENIVEVTNCATRLRITVNNDTLVQDTKIFIKGGAHGLVKNGKAIQVIVGLSVPQVRERFEALLQAANVSTQNDATEKSALMKAFATGKVIPIEEVKDEVFSAKMMGDGVAIWSENGIVTAPANGTVRMVMADTGHALGIELENGVEILIHIGIDTVRMQGQGFKVLVKQDDRFKVGDELVRFDLDLVKEKGYSPVIILAVTNFDKYTMLSFHSGMHAEAGKTVIATL